MADEQIIDVTADRSNQPVIKGHRYLVLGDRIQKGDQVIVFQSAASASAGTKRLVDSQWLPVGMESLGRKVASDDMKYRVYLRKLSADTTPANDPALSIKGWSVVKFDGHRFVQAPYGICHHPDCCK